MALKFFWNGIKDDGGKLQLCHYSLGNLTPKFPENTITIYARTYRPFGDGVRAAFTIDNGTDIMTDYFENDRIRVLPDHPLYSQVLAAVQKWQAHAARRRT